MNKQWIVRIGDEETAKISVDREGDIVMFVERDDGIHLAALALKSLRGCQLGMALIDASREAGVLRRKLEDKAEREAARLKKKVDAAIGLAPRKAKKKR